MAISLAASLSTKLLIDEARSVVDEKNKLQRNLLRTETILKSTGSAAGFSVGQLHDQAREAALTTPQQNFC